MAGDRRQQLKEADRFARRGKLGKAAEIYRTLAAEKPRDLSLQQKLADALSRSGNEREAGEIFSRLAEQYWESGHRSRAIATLKRAIRVRPKSPRLLIRLGSWMLEQGHPADARQPLLDAGALEINEEAAAEGQESFELLARHCANDPAVQEAHVRIVETLREPRDIARAKSGLAVALVRSGKPEQAGEALKEALEADVEEMSALSRIAHLIEVVDDLDAGALLDDLSSRGEGPRVAGTIVVAAWHARHARSGEGAALLEDALGVSEGWTADARLYAADVTTELERYDLAASLVDECAAEGVDDAGKRKRLVRVLHRVLAGRPEHPRSLELLRDLTGDAGAGAVPVDDVSDGADEPAPIAASSSIEDTGPEAIEEPPPPRRRKGPLPAEPMQILVEARALFGHGLGRRAMKVLASIDPRFKGHPDVVALLDQFAAAGVSPEESDAAASMPVHAAPAAGSAPHAESSDDLFVLTEDDETGVLLDQTSAFSHEAPDAVAVAVAEVEDDEDDTVTEVLAVGPVEDDVTRYEVAIGLVQMGLEQQAVPLLEECLERPERRAEAALELVRIHTGRGELDRALGVGERALEAPDLTLPVRTELLAELVAVAVHLGRTSLARESLDELDALSPGHAALEGLKARVAATEN